MHPQQTLLSHTGRLMNFDKCDGSTATATGKTQQLCIFPEVSLVRLSTPPAPDDLRSMYWCIFRVPYKCRDTHVSLSAWLPPLSITFWDSSVLAYGSSLFLFHGYVVFRYPGWGKRRFTTFVWK